MTQTTKDYITIYDLKTALATKREELNLSVRDLGKKAGVSYTVIYDFEIRGIVPKIETLFKIADALGLDLNITLNKSTTKKVKKDSPYEEIQQNLFTLGLDDNDIKEVMHFIEFIEFKLYKENNKKITVDDFPEEIEY